METIMIMTKKKGRSAPLPWRVSLYYRIGGWVVHARPKSYKLGPDADRYMLAYKNGYGLASYIDLEAACEACDMMNKITPHNIDEIIAQCRSGKYSDISRKFSKHLKRIIKLTDGLRDF